MRRCTRFAPVADHARQPKRQPQKHIIMAQVAPEVVVAGQVVGPPVVAGQVVTPQVAVPDRGAGDQSG